jgi:hypothetical protein
MTRTKRIYNKPNLKKAHRIDLSITDIPNRLTLKEQVETGVINSSLRNSVHEYGFLYHPYAQMCMGNCPMCRNAKKDQKYIRKARKSEFQQMLKEEMQKEQDINGDVTGTTESI